MKIGLNYKIVFIFLCAIIFGEYARADISLLKGWNLVGNGQSSAIAVATVFNDASKVTTVWNPWEETCAQISDLPDAGYETFVCVEATNAFDYPIQLAPGESHETTAIIGLEE